MRALGVEFVAKAIEASLLCDPRVRRRSRGLGFEGPVHAFVSTVLLRLAWFDELGEHAQAHPPGRKL